ncbi:alkaline phosphatase D family protein [Aeoliella straminimaris]|nr:alkaline phosphatase D family protein [Aeoliella straminimaris]
MCTTSQVPTALAAFVAVAMPALVAEAATSAEQPVCMNTGIKIAELSDSSVVVWTRTTDSNGHAQAAQVQVAWRESGTDQPWNTTKWVSTTSESDAIHQARLEGLSSGTGYQLEVRSRSTAGQAGQTIESVFRTHPETTTPSDVTLVIANCQQYEDRDDRENGFRIYQTMLGLQPTFFVHTGDVVYYDKPPLLGKNVANAREKWRRIYSMPWQVEFHNRVPAYFLKDDHDILKDDCWPGQTYGELTFDQGVSIFREQTAAPPVPYRTIRYGRDLQLWLLDGREFRSPNTMEDGPQKTILGREQWEWLERTLADSEATFKLVISPTPIVGPDRENKHDNLANKDFQHEGQRLRELLSGHKNLWVICGDRHWQYVSVDPESKLREYSCGPASDQHAQGWKKDEFVEGMHRYLRVAGGFMSVVLSDSATTPQLAIRHHAVDGEVKHEEIWPSRTELP